jgi:hypothetical protein
VVGGTFEVGNACSVNIDHLRHPMFGHARAPVVFVEPLTACMQKLQLPLLEFPFASSSLLRGALTAARHHDVPFVVSIPARGAGAHPGACAQLVAAAVALAEDEAVLQPMAVVVDVDDHLPISAAGMIERAAAAGASGVRIHVQAPDIAALHPLAHGYDLGVEWRGEQPAHAVAWMAAAELGLAAHAMWAPPDSDDDFVGAMPTMHASEVQVPVGAKRVVLDWTGTSEASAYHQVSSLVRRLGVDQCTQKLRALLATQGVPV